MNQTDTAGNFQHSPLPTDTNDNVVSSQQISIQQYVDLDYAQPMSSSPIHPSLPQTNSFAISPQPTSSNAVSTPNQYDPISIQLLQQTLQTPIPTTNSFSNQNQLNQPVHINKFFYQPPNDPFNYHVECEKISLQLLNMSTQSKEYEYSFYYQQQYNKQIYKISCEIVCPSLINDCLNKYYYGVEIKQNMKQEQLAFTLYQKENLKFHLTLYLNHHLLN
ncbi:hypothetical protein C1645_814523 [Glomus cerebriforme]|uniref:Uncharacterized protein n=1 Tax=Glomus cerebriforme TaxID=658196 RepID=A0A397TQI8_9GLOM|nr:hypothetical protein C1645_814523 [Glomus cerebriforme]